MDGGKSPRRSTAGNITELEKQVDNRAERRQGLIKSYWGSGVSGTGGEDTQTPRGDRMVAV